MRIVLLIVANLAVTLILGAVCLGLEMAGILPRGQWGHLFAYSTVFGFGGAFVSLLLSKMIAKWSLGVHVIENPMNPHEQWLVETVRRHATRAGIDMPEVGIFDSPDPNAFATGPTANSSLVAVSTGLLNMMHPEQVSAVLGHEVSHAANGDMVTLTLIQGVVNTFVIFLARVVGSIVDKVVFRSERGTGPGYFISVMVLEIVFGILASIIVAWFSRQREFRADAGAANYIGTPTPMVNALKRLGGLAPGELPKAMQAFGITEKSGIMALFSTHPPIEQRIAALQAAGR
jgi:heat shock protein HtpX